MTHTISHLPDETVPHGHRPHLPGGCCGDCSGDCSGDCACGVESLARPNYSYGMLLEARHLAMEHRYHALRMNTHDIRLHDFGTVCGLRVEPHPSAECWNRFAILRPGIALDCCGREIVVPEDLYVPLVDGATSGWCGCGQEAGHVPAAPDKPVDVPPFEKLYILLRYRQCDTDPIPAYVRPCGCCGPCDHGDCVPSVTREGYEVVVTTTPPRPWRNPMGSAFCAWLDARLGTSPQVGAVAEQMDGNLQQALCEVVTAPCLDFCVGDNDDLLLATVTYVGKDSPPLIDNCTDRRLVLSTGAIVVALECLTTAVIDCCGKEKPPHSPPPPLRLEARVEPTTAPVSPAGDLEYTVRVSNAGSVAAPGFTLRLNLDDLALTADKAKLDGNPVSPDVSGRFVAVAFTTLAPGAHSDLVVTALYPNNIHTGSVTATASIEAYHPAATPPPRVVLTTFVGQEEGEGPRVLITSEQLYPKYPGNQLPTSLELKQALQLIRQGMVFAFDMDMTPNPADGAGGSNSVMVEIQGVPLDDVVVKWRASNVMNVTSKKLTALLKSTENPKIGVTLAGSNPTASLRSVAGAQLDGEVDLAAPLPPKSGDGTQGGDFVWTIQITG